MTFAADPDRFAALFHVAEAQSGFFTAQQAERAGYSRQLLRHHLLAKRVERWLRGVYRLVHFPQMSTREDLVIYWLWSERQGVFSHETALSIHELSDALPARVHMTVPAAWAHRRLHVPAVVTLNYGAVRADECVTIDGVPVTTAARTVNDCASAGVAPDLVQQAISEGLARKLFSATDVEPAHTHLRAYAA